MHAKALILLFLIPIAVFSSTIKGKVVESDGITPVEGATVRLCSGKTGWWGYCEHSVFTQTNADGTYELQLPANIALKPPTTRRTRINRSTILSKGFYDLSGRSINTAITPGQRSVDGLWIGSRAGSISQAVYISPRNVSDNNQDQSLKAVPLAKIATVPTSITVSPIGYYPAVIQAGNTNLEALDNQIIELTRTSYYQDARLLDSAYRLDSPELLHKFMDSQSDHTPPITADAYASLDDTLRAIHDVFNVVYRPDSLAILNEMLGSLSSTDQPYAVVQSTIHFDILATEDLSGTSDASGAQMYAGFHPVTALEQTSVIYETPQYDSILTNYLMLNDDRKRQDSQNRLEFVQQAVYLGQNHLGTAWYFATGPSIRIVFNSSLTKAQVRFFVHHHTGMAILHKTGQKWILIESTITGIE